jgi:hypothetical protein
MFCPLYCVSLSLYALVCTPPPPCCIPQCSIPLYCIPLHCIPLCYIPLCCIPLCSIPLCCIPLCCISGVVSPCGVSPCVVPHCVVYPRCCIPGVVSPCLPSPPPRHMPNICTENIHSYKAGGMTSRRPHPFPGILMLSNNGHSYIHTPQPFDHPRGQSHETDPPSRTLGIC